MDTPISLLTDFGYIPSYRPKNPKPLAKLLEDEDSWNALIADVKAYIKSCKVKRKDGEGVVKPFHITLIDTGVKDTSEKKQTGKVWLGSYFHSK